MRLGIRVDSWRGDTRLARDLPVVAWTWSEKWPAMPAGKLTVDCPATLWPIELTDPLRPMGQVLRVELHHEEFVTPLPPLRIAEVAEGAGVVSVTADTIDGAISEDPWPYPSSPRTGATLLQEATRLADPLRVKLETDDGRLPNGLAWSGDRDDALLELVESRAARWQLDADGTLVAVPLGNVAEPHRIYSVGEVVEAVRKVARTRVSKATAVAQASGNEVPAVVVRRLTEDAYQPDVYGTIGKVESMSSGGTRAQLEAAASAMLAEGGESRDFTITPDPTLRAGMVARLEVSRRTGPESFVGRVAGHSLSHTGAHTITIQEA